jgi:L-alanine-DL-glutamate epimerase-like enolase superfamily enzyme
MAAFHIALVEEPLAESSVDELLRLRQNTDVPLMVDESLVTEADADALLTSGAIDFVNIRVSKCGGLGPSLALARRAAANGIGVVVGAHVGETAILSAAGRLVAASTPETAFVEGSFGSLLLVEDISTNPVRFGRAGVANVLGGAGLGVAIDEDRLRKFSSTVRSLVPAGGER